MRRGRSVVSSRVSGAASGEPAGGARIRRADPLEVEARRARVGRGGSAAAAGVLCKDGRDPAGGTQGPWRVARVRPQRVRPAGGIGAAGGAHYRAPDPGGGREPIEIPSARALEQRAQKSVPFTSVSSRVDEKCMTQWGSGQ